MLFRALLSRLNGGSDTASTRVSSLHRRFSSLAYEKYQNLPGLILRLLSQASIQRPDNLLNSNYSEACLKHAQRVFPVLEIVERFGLPFEYREEIQYLIWQQMEGPIWALREKAAKTLSLVIGGENFISELFNLLKDSRKSQNNLHGRLMCARFIVSHMDNESKGKSITI